MSRRSRSPGPVRYGPTQSLRGKPTVQGLWKTISLDPADHQVYGIGPEGSEDWDVELNGGNLRVTALTTRQRDWCNSAEQDGLVVIVKLPVNPFPIQAVSGLTGDTWRGEYATMKTYSKVRFGSASTAPKRLTTGPGIVAYTNDQSGTPAGPAFETGATQPSWYYYMHVDQSDNATTYQFNEAWGGNGDCGYHPGAQTPAFGTAGQTNRMELAVQGWGGEVAYPSGSKSNASPLAVGMIWSDDTDPTEAYAWTRGFAPNPTDGAHLKVDGKYLHVAHFFGSWDDRVAGDYVEVLEWKYMVQQFPQRGAE